jgi:hypothetical protein
VLLRILTSAWVSCVGEGGEKFEEISPNFSLTLEVPAEEAKVGAFSRSRIKVTREGGGIQFLRWELSFQFYS